MCVAFYIDFSSRIGDEAMLEILAFLFIGLMVSITINLALLWYYIHIMGK